MSTSNFQKNLHLIWRAGFGPMVELLPLMQNTAPNEFWKLIKSNASETPTKITVGAFNDLQTEAAAPTGNMQNDTAAKEKIEKILQKSKGQTKQLSLLWMNEMINSKAQLREKMAFFWHGHFATRVLNGAFNEQLLQVIRAHALGNFGDLLIAVSKSPAMLRFLNNQQNKKQKPNENFAREVMELFTLGRGNYTEQDIKEAARAFTGWTFLPNGTFIQRPLQHDNGVKTFLGKTGNFNGDDVLKIILEQKQTAYFITKKIYTYFVNEQVPKDRLYVLAENFYTSGYNIMQLLESIFTASWFFDTENMGNKVKSPIELIVGIQRILPLYEVNEVQVFSLQKLLGQQLFFPPNVAGWPIGTNWIDSSTLLIRMQAAYLLSGQIAMLAKPKIDDDTDMGNLSTEQQQSVQPAYNFNTRLINTELLSYFTKLSPEVSLEKIMEALLIFPKQVNAEVVAKFSNTTSSTQNSTASKIIQTMAVPEYQLS